MMVLQALFDLENTNQDFKTELQDLYINSAVYGFKAHALFQTFMCFLPFKLPIL